MWYLRMILAVCPASFVNRLRMMALYTVGSEKSDRQKETGPRESQCVRWVQPIRNVRLGSTCADLLQRYTTVCVR